MQSGSSLFAGGLPANHVGPVSEDCLTVDVWTPATGDGGRRPVMVWVCGGAYLTGGSAVETYDGAALSGSQDVVVVSVNYRMGALGFLWVDGGDSNCGLRDQLAALAWVRAHAEEFGGDPENVTVFGESAGAGSVLHILATASGTGLVRRAIMQSPGVEHTQDSGHADRVRAAVMDAAGARESDLLTLPWPALLDAQERALPGLMASIGSLPFHPVVDGDVVPAAPGVVFDAPGLDVLICWTAEEMRLYPDRRADDRDQLARRVAGLIERRTGEVPGAAAVAGLIEMYSPCGTGADIWAAIQTDALMRLPARRVAGLSVRSGTRTHVAQFDWGASGGDWRKGAFHAIDLPFTFGTLDRAGWLEFLGAAGGDDRGAFSVAAAHMSAWGSFARSGDPGWAPYPDAVMRFDVGGGPAVDPLVDAAAAWTGLWVADGAPM